MRILFIGNSYTYYNDMPKLFETLARENGKDVSVDSVTEGGRRLAQNLCDGDELNARIRELVKRHSYDVLILQEQSYLALVDYEQFERGVAGLIELVCAKRNILYATWGRKSGSDLLAKHGWTSDGMTEMLCDAYCRVADKYSAEISQVGLGFADICSRDASVELYDPDLSHPSYIGTCLGVLMHYKSIFGELAQDCSSLGLDRNVESAILDTVTRI